MNLLMNSFVVCCLLSLEYVSGMECCDYKTLNRKVDAYVMALEENRDIAKDSVQDDLCFLSDEAIQDIGLKTFTREEEFQRLYSRKVDVPKVNNFADVCMDIFKTSSSDLEKVQVYILLERVTLMLEILKSSGMSFVPTVFD